MVCTCCFAGLQLLPLCSLLAAHQVKLESLLTADVVLTSYQMLRTIVNVTDCIDFHRVVFDESQYLKNSGSLMALLSARLVAKHRWCASGN